MIKSLNFLRLVASVCVFLFHLEYRGPLGTIGISFFFVLSGFIITYNYYDKLTINNAPQFYILRLARIYPVYLLTLLLSLPLTTNIEVKTLLLNALMLQSYIPEVKTFFSFNFVSWAVSNQMFFYVLTPVIFYLMHKINIIKAIKTYGVFIWVGLFILSYIVASFFSNTSHIETAYSYNWWLLCISPYFRLFDFLLGVVLCLIFKEENSEKPDGYYTCLEVCSLIAVFVAYNAYFKYIGPLHYGLFFAPFTGFIIYVFAFQKGIISKTISNKMFVILGSLSFSFFMVHQLVIRYFAKYNMLTNDKLLHDFAIFSVSILVSLILYFLYEKPIRGFIRLRLKEMPTKQKYHAPKIKKVRMSLRR